MNSTEAGSSPAAGGSLFSDSEPEAIAYSSVSRLAVAGFVVGLACSWTALINPWLCIVPVLGAILDEVVTPDMVGILGLQADAGSVVEPEPSFLRAGSVDLNSFGAFAKWVSALVMPPPGLAAAR